MIDTSRHSFLLYLCAIISGMIALPMLPIWNSALRILCIFLIAQHFTQGKKSLVIYGSLVTQLALYASYIAHILPEGIPNLIISSITAIYGHPFGTLWDGAFLLHDIGILMLLGYVYRSKRAARTTVKNFYLCGISGMYLWALLTTIVNLSSLSNNDAAQAMTGLSDWAIWIIAAFLPLLLIKHKQDTYLPIKAIMLGTALMALSIVLQWLTRDFSYVLDAPLLKDYFYRARGTAYYHTAAMHIVIITIPLLVCFIKIPTAKKWLLPTLMFFCFIAWLNGSRGLSLSLAIASSITFLYALRIKSHYVTLISLLIGFFFLNNVFYIKPVSFNFETESAASINAVEVQNTELSRANSSRSVLNFQGLAQLSDAWYFGSGIGILKISLNGESFNGITETYSSHSIFLDIALMAGIPSLLFLGIACAILYYIAFKHSIIKQATNSWLIIGLLSSITAYLVSGLFLSQERNHIITIVFVLFSVLACSLSGEKSDTSYVLRIKRYKIYVFTTLLALGSLGWIALTSPSYLFPVIEFVGRYGKEAAAKNQTIYVNKAALIPAIRTILNIAFSHSPPVLLLTDDIEQLPTKDRWVIWVPSQDIDYPNLKKSLGHRSVRPNMHAPSLAFPDSWWVLPSAQPSTSFLYTGTRPLTNHAKEIKIFNHSDEPATPNLAPYMTPESTIKSKPSHYIADENFGSAIVWDEQRKAQFIFSTPQHQSALKLAAYTLFPLHTLPPHTHNLYYWSVEGANNKKTWTLLDQSSLHHTASENPNGFLFFIENNSPFRYYRFTFAPANPDQGVLGLTEINLHFSE